MTKQMDEQKLYQISLFIHEIAIETMEDCKDQSPKLYQQYKPYLDWLINHAQGLKEKIEENGEFLSWKKFILSVK